MFIARCVATKTPMMCCRKPLPQPGVRLTDMTRRAVRSFFFQAAPLESPDRPDIADHSQNVQADYEHRDELSRVSKMVDALPDKLRQAFTLQVLQDMPQSEVAEILGVSIKAVETRVYRARKIISGDVSDLGRDAR